MPITTTTTQVDTQEITSSRPISRKKKTTWEWYYVTPYFVQKIPWIPVRILFGICAHFKVEGLENLKDIPKNAIFAANHSSELDVMFLPAALPFWSRFSPIFYVNRARGMYDRDGFRRFLYNNSLFTIAGGQQYYPGLKDYEKSLVDHVRLLEDGKSLYVFPEGRITLDGSIQAAHGGVAYLALRTNTPIVPMAISGHFKMTPADFFFGRRRITIRFGKPIFPQELKAQVTEGDSVENPYSLQADWVMKRVEKLMKR